jgi:hypothetical protein
MVSRHAEDGIDAALSHQKLQRWALSGREFPAGTMKKAGRWHVGNLRFVEKPGELADSPVFLVVECFHRSATRTALPPPGGTWRKFMTLNFLQGDF